MFDEFIVAKAKEILQAENVEIVHRLLGGMSNYTYVIKADDKLYTFRILGEFAEKFVNRELEKENIKLFEQLNVTNKTIYLDVETGIKIAEYIEGTSLNQLTEDEYPFEKVVQKLKIVHNSNLKAQNDYNPFNRLQTYEQYLIDVNFVHPEKYNQLKKEFFKYKPYLDSIPKVLCHGDSQPSNFVLTQDGDVVIVDFEFTGNNDLIYDIACFGNINFSSAKKLLQYYFSDNLDDDKEIRLYLWRIFQCFQWYNVAEFKDMYGLSEKLKIDFKAVANKYLQNIENLMNEFNSKQLFQKK